jgi:hypothetical protein
MLGADQGSMTWSPGRLITYKAKAADTRGVLSFFQWDVPVEHGSGWEFVEPAPRRL